MNKNEASKKILSSVFEKKASDLTLDEIKSKYKTDRAHYMENEPGVEAYEIRNVLTSGEVPIVYSDGTWEIYKDNGSGGDFPDVLEASYDPHAGYAGLLRQF